MCFLKVSEKVLCCFEVLDAVIWHELCEFTDCKWNVRMHAIWEVHAFSNECAVRQFGHFLTFIIPFWAHCYCKAECWAGCFGQVAVFHAKVWENLDHVLLLVNHEQFMILPLLYSAAKKLLSIASISDSKLLFDLYGCELWLSFGVWGNEEVVDTGGQDCYADVRFSNIDTPVWLISYEAKWYVGIIKM